MRQHLPTWYVQNNILPCHLTFLLDCQNALQDGLSSLPFGALRKAQNVLSRADAQDSDGSDGEGSSSGSEPEEQPSWGAKPIGKEKEKHAIEKRKNKHACVNHHAAIHFVFTLFLFLRPMEMTSKRPVPRKKIEIEEKGPVS